MRTYRRRIGDIGEDRATAWLIHQGFTIVGKNVRLASGEIDIIALKRRVLHFVEVKTRKKQAYGYGSEAITRKKLLSMTKSAFEYMRMIEKKEVAFVLDVISIDAEKLQYYSNVTLDGGN